MYYVGGATKFCTLLFHERIKFYYLFQLHLHEQVCSVCFLTSKVPDGRHGLKFHCSESVLSRCSSSLRSKYGNITLPQIVPQPLHSTFHSFIQYKPVIFSVLCAEYQKYVQRSFCYARHDGIWRSGGEKSTSNFGLYTPGNQPLFLQIVRPYKELVGKQWSRGKTVSPDAYSTDSSAVKPVTWPLTHRANPVLQQIKTHLKQQ